MILEPFVNNLVCIIAACVDELGESAKCLFTGFGPFDVALRGLPHGPLDKYLQDIGLRGNKRGMDEKLFFVWADDELKNG